MQGIGAMRQRVTLMREQFDTAAGGRIVLTTPVIAQVWAEVTEQTSRRDGHADRQRKTHAATLRLRYCAAFMEADRVHIADIKYRIVSSQKRGLLNPVIEMQLQSLSSDQKAV